MLTQHSLIYCVYSYEYGKIKIYKRFCLKGTLTNYNEYKQSTKAHRVAGTYGFVVGHGD